jgi:phosphatidylinositol-3-phosphatase
VLAKPAAYPYLDETLVPTGALLTHYALVARSPLANDVALLSGQGPNAATEQNCPTYVPVTPPTLGGNGLASGTGCVYPSAVRTLAGELTTAAVTWRAYAQDMSLAEETATTGASTACIHPAAGEATPTLTPAAGKDYLAFRNPFAYFDSLLEDGACASNDVDLTQLEGDLAEPAKTPHFSWIIPAACDDGTSSPCATAGESGGASPTDTFLRGIVAQITATAAYRHHGMVMITFDNPPAGSSAPVGALLISPFVHHGARVSAPFDDFSLLKSLERLYRLPLLGHAADAGVTKLGTNVYSTGVAP